MNVAQELVTRARARALTVVTAESLTAGWVSSAIAAVPGCSDVLRGGVVAYSVEVKRRVLGLTDEELAGGVVSVRVAEAMAVRAVGLFGADVGLATTGVAGPEPHDGTPVGTACLAVCTPTGVTTWTLVLPGDRDQVRWGCVHAVLARAAELLA